MEEIQITSEISKRSERLIKLAFIFFALGFLTLIFAIVTFTHGEAYNSKLPINSNKFGDFGSFLSGAVGAVWSFVGVILFYVTLQLQRKELSLQREELTLTRDELRKTAEANKQIADDTKANAIVDLYQTYTNDYFFSISSSAWNVLMNCLANKDYCDYIVSTFFVTDHSSNIGDEHKNLIYKVYKDKLKEESDNERHRILQLEHDERHKLEDFINFYSVLALRDAPKEIFEQCDFFYDWWRPLLWWLCDKRWAAYINDKEKMKYSTKPHHLKTLRRLDFIYGFETLEDTSERWTYFQDHPIVKKNTFDNRHKDPYLEYSAGTD